MRAVLLGLVLVVSACAGPEGVSSTSSVLEDPTTAAGLTTTTGVLTTSSTLAAITTSTTLAATTTSGTPTGDNSPIDLGPLESRGGHSVVWTGSEMIVWGGEADEMGSELFSDGAAYNPDTESWSLLPASPLTGRRYHLAAWTGEEMLVVGGVGESDGAAYNPASGSWRSIEEAPIPVGPPAGTGSSGLVGEAWTGKELVVWHVASDQIAAYDPVEDQWRELPAPPLDADLGVLRWNGADLYAVGANTSVYPQDVPLLLAKLTHGEDNWESLPEVGLSTDMYNIGARPELTAWAGETLLAWTDSGSDGRTVAFDPRSGIWADVARNPLHGCEAAPEPLTLDDRVLVYDWCGPDAIYEPTTDTWTNAHIDGSPQARYTVWTGTKVLNWGDTCCYGTGGQPFTIQAWQYEPEG